MKKFGRRFDWKTPLSCCKSLAFYEVIDNQDGLFIVVGPLNDDSRYRFMWKHYIGYKNIFEEFGLPWAASDNPDPWTATSQIQDSPWLAEVRGDIGDCDESFVDMLHPNPKHFVILTADYVMEILSEEEPEISLIEHRDEIDDLRA